MLYATHLNGQSIESASLKYNHRYQERINYAEQLFLKQPDSSWNHFVGLLREGWLERNIPVVRTCLVALSGFTEHPRYREKALYYAQRGIQLSDTLKHRKYLSALYSNIAKMKFSLSMYAESLEANSKAAYYASDPINAAKIENNMIAVLVFLNQAQRAKELADRSIEVGAKYQNGELWSSALNNKAHTLLNKDIKDIQGALLYLDSSIKIAKHFKQYQTLYVALQNKGSILAKSGRAKEAVQYIKAADTLIRHFPIALSFQMKSQEILGTAYAHLGQFALSEQHFLKCIQNTDQHNKLNATLELSLLYADFGHYKKAYTTYKELMEKVDNIASAQVQGQVRHLEIQYRTLEKDKLIAENRLLLSAREHDLKVKNLWIAIFATGGSLLLCLVFFLRRNFNHKKKILMAEQANIGLKARLEGEELERKRIAGELHDGVGGILSAAKMNLSSIDPALHDNSPEYIRSVGLLDEAYKELRQTAHNLSPHLLKSKGLVESTFIYCQKATSAKGIELKFQHHGALNQLDESVTLTIYRIIQELVQNIIKHSRATSAMIQISLQDDELHIAVEDNGTGMLNKDLNEGMGLGNIRDRVNAMNGEVEIDTQDHEGTAVYIHFSAKPAAKIKKYHMPPTT